MHQNQLKANHIEEKNTVQAKVMPSEMNNFNFNKIAFKLLKV